VFIIFLLLQISNYTNEQKTKFSKINLLYPSF